VPVVRFGPISLFMSIITANHFDLEPLDFKDTFVYGKLKETIIMHLPEGDRDDNTVAHRMMCIYGLNYILRDGYSCS
jgi:hypothetical protein